MKPPQSAAIVVAAFLLAAAAGSTAIAGRYYAGSMNCRTATDDLPRQLVDDLSRQRGTNWFDQHYSWSCRIDGVQWAISVHRQGADQAEGYEAGSDGETTYTVGRVKAAAPGSNDSLAVIENGVMPYESSLPVHPVWLTFCAPSLLRFFPGNKMPMLAAMGASDSREARMAKYEFRYEIEPRTELFSSFELLNDGFIRETLRDGRFIVIRRDPPHDSGFVMSRLSIHAFKVVGELLGPSEVVYERFKPSSKKEKNVTLVERWKLSVTSSYTTNLGTLFWVPNPSAVMDIKDRRFAHSVPPVFSINYRLKSGKWLPREDAFLIKQYESATGAQSGSARSPKGFRRVLALSFIGLTTVAFCFLLWRNRAHLVHS